jgi:bifunctional UDP-N-acetylglucosamine pyrophosphorylase/glucosamine-1-phosphate N-acetyltransferase
MKDFAAVILAAGKGTRMNEGLASPIPKVMFKIANKPMVEYGVENMESLGINPIVLVVGYKKELVMEYFGDRVEYTFQTEQLGTGHAVSCAKDVLQNKSENLIVFYGDNPLFKKETINKLIELFNKEKPAIAMLTAQVPDPFNYGRIIRNDSGNIIANVEQTDCTEAQKQIKEINPCFYIFRSDFLWQHLSDLATKNTLAQYYLTDLIKIAVNSGEKVIGLKIADYRESLGVNNPDQLNEANDFLNNRAVVA